MIAGQKGGRHKAKALCVQAMARYVRLKTLLRNKMVFGFGSAGYRKDVRGTVT